MSKHFRPWKIDLAQLLPPSVPDHVPEDHQRYRVHLGMKPPRGRDANYTEQSVIYMI